MSLAAQDLCISAEDYLEYEETSVERHEYVAGRMFAMVGATEFAWPVTKCEIAHPKAV